MTPLDALREFLEKNQIRGPRLVAASGGLDSTALLVALREIGTIEFEVAHINHHLRGADSDADEQFVRSLVPGVHVADGTLDSAEVRRVGIEAAARRVRYERLHEIRRAIGATYIATAHQKNDQAETVLMNFRGIDPVRSDGVIRPLLVVTRAEIERFLAERNITARVDRSNTDPRFVRNRIRAALDPAAVDSLASMADQAREQWNALQQSLDRVDDSIQTPHETRFKTMPNDAWLRRALLHRHIHRLDPEARDVSSADLARLAESTSKRVSVTKNLEMLRRNGEVILRKRQEQPAPFEVAIAPGNEVRTPLGTILVRSATGDRRPATGNRPTQRFELPHNSKATFTVRTRRNGDRFQPLGMRGHKKLKDFLIDRKIPAEARDRIPLLLWNETIVWVAGVEISEAFKVTGAAGDLYEVSFEEESQEGVQSEADRQTHR